jgi:hypothetical protein
LLLPFKHALDAAFAHIEPAGVTLAGVFYRAEATFAAFGSTRQAIEAAAQAAREARLTPRIPLPLEL